MLTVLVLTYIVLLRAFRSVILPLKAVLLNILSITATYGILVITFKWGAGQVIGLTQSNQIEAWIPIFLFAMLFGLSMDYEVFLLSRMREIYDETGDTTLAVTQGLQKTGRIVTAAAAIMVAAFSGFVLGSLLGLQEFGWGLAIAITIDATVIRALLVPALMAIMGSLELVPARLGSARCPHLPAATGCIGKRRLKTSRVLLLVPTELEAGMIPRSSPWPPRSAGSGWLSPGRGPRTRSQRDRRRPTV